MRLVERGVQAQAVQGQVGAQPVGRGPADILAQIRGQAGDDLSDDHDGEEQHGGFGQRARRATAPRRVNKETQDLRVDELERDVAQQQHSEQCHAPPLRSEIRNQ